MHNPRHIPRRTQSLMDNVRTLPRQDPHDLEPINLQLIEQEMRDPRSQRPWQQEILRSERKRLGQAQYNHLLQNEMRPYVPEDEDKRKRMFLLQLMEMMRRRHGLKPQL